MPKTTQATVKSRGKDQAVASTDNTQVCPNKFINNPTPVQLSFGEVSVRDIPLDAWLTNISNVFPALMAMADSVGGASEVEVISLMASNPEVKAAFYSLIAHSVTELTPEDISNLRAADALKLGAEVLQVVNLREIKELFTQLGSTLKPLSTTESK